jgi:hypothetical protein
MQLEGFLFFISQMIHKYSAGDPGETFAHFSAS